MGHQYSQALLSAHIAAQSSLYCPCMCRPRHGLEHIKDISKDGHPCGQTPSCSFYRCSGNKCAWRQGGWGCVWLRQAADGVSRGDVFEGGVAPGAARRMGGGHCRWYYQNKTPVTSKPHFQALPSGWTKRLHAGMLAPSTNNDVYLSRATVGPVLTEAVMDVAKDGKHAAETLLLTCLFDHTATKSEMPSIKMLKPWLGKPLNNAHLNLEDCIFRACTTTTGFVGRSKAETKRLVHRRGYHKSYNRRCGVLSAFSAVFFFIAEVTPTSTPFLKENAEMRLPLLSSTSRILFSATCALGLRHGGSTVA